MLDYLVNKMVERKKGSPYSTTKRRVPELFPVHGSQLADDVSHKPGSMLPLLSARPPQPLRGEGCYQFCCLVNRSTMGVNSLPKTVNRQRQNCDLNPSPSVPESSTLTTRLLSHAQNVQAIISVCNHSQAGHQCSPMTRCLL